MGKRRKTLAVTVYFDPDKYADKLEYIRETVGFTDYFTKCVADLVPDPQKLELVRQLRATIRLLKHQ